MGRGKARQRANASVQSIDRHGQAVAGQEQAPGPREARASGLETALSTYRESLEDLPRERHESAPARVMRALLARSHLAEAMSAAGASLGRDTLERVLALDERLKSSATVLDDVVGKAVLASWRETVRPPEDAWWWSLDTRAAEHHQEHAVLWLLFGGMLVTVSVSLSTEICQRFLSGGPDFLGIFSTLTQALLTLIAGSAFTEYGSKRLERILSRRAIRHGHRPMWRLGLGLALFGAILALRLSLPAIARVYDDWGRERFNQRQDYPGALRHFRRAVSLDPSFEQAHYHLAVTSEQMLDHEQAIREYELARMLGSTRPQVSNNLARLYLRGEKYEDALRLLEQADQQKGSRDANFAYAHPKNRGWALLGLKLHQQARVELEKALMNKPKAVAAHCLLAQVLELRNQLEEALGHWGSCADNYDQQHSQSLSSPDQPSLEAVEDIEAVEVVEAAWIETARARVNQAAEGP